MKSDQIQELLLQALETETGGIRVYQTALRCALNEELKEEWKKYLDQTRNHERILLDVLQSLGINSEAKSPGREVVRHIGHSLVKAMELALAGGNREAAEIVACECVVLAETKDHMNWELIGNIAKEAKGTMAKVLKEASQEVEKEEDEHLYHTTGWARELWIGNLGLPAVLPPPEEVKEVETAIGAARAKQSRKEML